MYSLVPLLQIKVIWEPPTSDKVTFNLLRKQLFYLKLHDADLKLNEPGNLDLITHTLAPSFLVSSFFEL